MAYANFFEIKFTPERDRKLKVEKIVEEVEEEVVLVLAPFNPIPKLEFTTDVNNTISKSFKVQNPSSHQIHVEFMISDPDAQLIVNPCVVDIESQGTADVSVQWTAPSLPVHARYSVKTNAGPRLPHLAVICNSLSNKPKKGASGKVVPKSRAGLKNPKQVSKTSKNIASSHLTKDENCSDKAESVEDPRRLTYVVPRPLKTLNTNCDSSCSIDTLGLTRVGHNSTYTIPSVAIQACCDGKNDAENIPPLSDFPNATGDNCPQPSKDWVPKTGMKRKKWLSPSAKRPRTSSPKLLPEDKSKAQNLDSVPMSTPYKSEGSDTESLLHDSSVLSSIHLGDGHTILEYSPIQLQKQGSPFNEAIVQNTKEDISSVKKISRESPKRRLHFTNVNSLSPKSLPVFKPKKRTSICRLSGLPSKERKMKVDLCNTFVLEPKTVPVIEEDPFSKEAVKYHTKGWLEEKEEELLKWLNAVLTPPEEWAGQNQPKLTQNDIANLWEKVNKSKMQLVPSKDTLADRFHSESGKWICLRKTALALYRYPDVAKVHIWLKGQISKKLIEVKNEIDLSKNEGSKKLLVQMLLRYKPLWLRIGLETIYNTSIHFGDSYKGLIIFLQNNLFANDVIQMKNKTQKRYILKVEMLKRDMNEYILEKFLMLIFFLDLAKMKKLIPYDPCLFQEDSPVKASIELLDEFISEYLKCVGGMKNNMNRNGYKLSYKQTCLDEFDFAIKERKDLRDGVRLTKAIEVFLKMSNLTPNLKVPATTICHKVHNVEVALKALANEGFKISGDISARDIVNGHYEKTLSLLWQILNRFIKPRYESAIRKIQIWWRSLSVCVARRVRIRRRARQEAAAVVIQSAWRGFKARSWFKDNKESLSLMRERWLEQQKVLRHSVSLIESRYKAHLEMKKCRKAFVSLKTNTIKIQRWYRSVKACQNDRKSYLLLREKAVLVQRWYRSVVAMTVCKKEYTLLRLNVILIQQKFRANRMASIDRNNYLSIKNSAVLIQRWYRTVSTGKKCRDRYITLKAHALFVQRRFRANQLMKSCQDEFKKMRNAAIIVQSWFRSIKLTKSCRNDFLKLRSQVVFVQRLYRANKLMKLERQKYICVKKSAVQIQEWYRRTKETQKRRETFLKLRASAVSIQRWYRSAKCLRDHMERYQMLKHYTIVVQRNFRLNRLGKSYRLRYLEMKQSAVRIQAWYRSISVARKSRAEFLALKQSVVMVQRRFRANNMMKTCQKEFIQKRESALKIQVWFRSIRQMEMCRNDYNELKLAVICIQQRFRANRQMKSVRSDYLLMKSSAILIQDWFRSSKKTAELRCEFLKIKEKVVFLQRTYRSIKLMHQCRKDYLALKTATCCIQQRFRANRQMKSMRREYLLKKSSAILIQNWFRSLKKGAEVREDFLRLKRKTVLIQRWFRGIKQMLICRNDYRKLKMAALCIQNRYRANVLMGNCRRDFLLKRSSAVKIQRWLRSVKLMVKCKSDYAKLRCAAVVVQQRYQANKLMIEIRNEYLLRKSSAIKIQCWYRSSKKTIRAREEFLNARDKVVCIQRWYRSTKEAQNCRKRYLRMKSSAIYIQQKFRANKLMEKSRSEFLLKKSSAIKIQCWYKETKRAAVERALFLEYRKHVVLVQSRYRYKKEMQKCRNEFVALKSAAVLVQRRYRAYKAMQAQRSFYLKLKHSAVEIQNLYRSLKRAREERKRFLELREKVVCIQRWYRSVKEARTCRRDFLLLRSTAIQVQRRVRANLLASRLRSEFLVKRASAVAIQRKFRGHLETKRCLKEFRMIVEAAVKIQRWFRSNRAAAAMCLEVEQCPLPSKIPKLKVSSSPLPEEVPPKVALLLMAKRKSRLPADRCPGEKPSLQPASKKLFKAKYQLVKKTATPSTASVEEEANTKKANEFFWNCLTSETEEALPGGNTAKLKDIEKKLMNWVNATVLPSEWTDVQNRRMSQDDIAKLWKRVANTNVVQQPRPSTCFHDNQPQEDNRLRCLRKAARNLFKSDEIQGILAWLRYEISEKKIEVKDEIDLSRNTVSRMVFVQMVFSYDPVWLRIGLETLCDVKIPSANYKTLILFIKQNLMSNEILPTLNPSKRKFYMNVENLKNETNKYILEKFFMLVYFLDQAKTNKLIASNPPLFQSCSTVKSSQEVLDNFMKEFLKCVSCVKKGMDRHSYKLNHKVSFFDRFDLYVNKCSDFSDGVQLIRILEVILNSDLIKLLKFPARTEAQKTNNVEIALRALKRRGFVADGDIRPEDIVKGDRVKTLSLIWQILNKFMRNRYNTSAVKIQRWWRSKLFRLTLKRRIELKNNSSLS